VCVCAREAPKQEERVTLSRAEENKVKGGRRRAVAVIDGPWGRRMLIHRQSTTFYVQTIANGFLAKLNRIVKADFEKAIAFLSTPAARAKIISPRAAILGMLSPPA
jgi:hypothetical protein